MSSPFDAAMAAADAVLNGVFGEGFLITPKTLGAEDDGDVDAAPRRDPRRSVISATLTFHEAPTEYFPAARGIARNSAQPMVGADIMLSVLAVDLTWQPRAGDLAYRKNTGLTYQVAKVQPDGAGRIWLPATLHRQR